MSAITYAIDNIGIIVTILIVACAVTYVLLRKERKLLILKKLRERFARTKKHTAGAMSEEKKTETVPTNMPHTSIIVSHKQEHVLQNTKEESKALEKIPSEYFSKPKEEQERIVKEHSEYANEDQAIQQVLAKTMPKESRISAFIKDVDDHVNAHSLVQKTLPKATGNERFFMHNGMVLEDLAQLRDALPNMSDEQFYMHVNTTKNDFAAWTQGVFALHDLAARMRKATTRQSLHEVLLQEL